MLDKNHTLYNPIPYRTCTCSLSFDTIEKEYNINSEKIEVRIRIKKRNWTSKRKYVELRYSPRNPKIFTCEEDTRTDV